MKLLLSLFFVTHLQAAWLTNFDEAKQLAKTRHAYILLSFSGSDWCGPCIRMHKEVFEDDAFVQYAGTHLVLVNADFPRLRKNKLPPDQEKQNDALADLYNPKGTFPLTLLLDADGKVIRSWEGFFPDGAAVFTGQINSEIISRSE